VSSAHSTSACTQVTDERGCIYYFPALVLDYWRCTLACTQPTSIALFQCTHSDSRFIRESPNIAGRGLISSIGHVHPWRPGRAVNRVGAGWVVGGAGDADDDADAKWDSSEQLFTIAMPYTSKISYSDSSSTSIAGNHGDSG